MAEEKDKKLGAGFLNCVKRNKAVVKAVAFTVAGAIVGALGVLIFQQATKENDKVVVTVTKDDDIVILNVENNNDRVTFDVDRDVIVTEEF